MTSKPSQKAAPAPVIQNKDADDSVRCVSDADSDSSWVMVGCSPRKKKLPKRPSSIGSRGGSASPDLDPAEQEQILDDDALQAEETDTTQYNAEEHDGDDGVSVDSDNAQKMSELRAIVEKLVTQLDTYHEENEKLRDTIDTRVSEQKAERNGMLAHILGMRQSHQQEMTGRLEESLASTKGYEDELQSIRDSIRPLQAQSVLAKEQDDEQTALMAALDSARDNRHDQYVTMQNRLQKLEKQMHGVVQEREDNDGPQQNVSSADLERLGNTIKQICNENAEEVLGLRNSYRQMDHDVTSLREQLAEVVAKLNEKNDVRQNHEVKQKHHGSRVPTSSAPKTSSSKSTAQTPATLYSQAGSSAKAKAPAVQQDPATQSSDPLAAQERHRQHMQYRIRVTGCPYCATSPTSDLYNIWQ